MFCQAFRDVWSNERLLNLVEQLLGSSDIVGHPVWNLRTKTPNNEATTVPWHQGKSECSDESNEDAGSCERVADEWLVVMQEVGKTLLQKILVQRPFLFGRLAQRVVFPEHWLVK